MAAPCTTFVRSALKGVLLVPGRWLRTQRHLDAAAVPVCRPLHLSAGPSRSTKPDPQSSAEAHETTGSQGDEEQSEGPEYIPKRKAKNPMMVIGYAWMIGLPSGIIGFLLVKRQVDKNRLKQLKVRQRMKSSNEGEYESRYSRHAEGIKLDR